MIPTDADYPAGAIRGCLFALPIAVMIWVLLCGALFVCLILEVP